MPEGTGQMLGIVWDHLAQLSAATQHCIDSTSGWKTSGEIWNYDVLEVLPRHLIFEGAGSWIQTDLSNTSYKYSIELTFQANMMTMPFNPSFKKAPKTTSEQLWPDDNVHYGVGIAHHCWGTWNL